MRIREMREARGMKQRELAEKAGITAAYLCDLEKGKKRNPSIALLVRIAEVLNVTLIDLLEQKAS